MELKKIEERLSALYPKLTKKKREFLYAYLSTGSITQAVKQTKAYSAVSNASRMITNDSIFQEILHLEQLKIYHQDNLRPLMMAKLLQSVQETTLESGDYKTFLKSLELEAKIRGIIGSSGLLNVTEKVVEDFEKKKKINIRAMTKEERDFYKGYLTKLKAADLTKVNIRDLFTDEEIKRVQEIQKTRCYSEK